VVPFLLVFFWTYSGAAVAAMTAQGHAINSIYACARAFATFGDEHSANSVHFSTFATD
jgi:hypothetical protein